MCYTFVEWNNVESKITHSTNTINIRTRIKEFQFSLYWTIWYEIMHLLGSVILSYHHILLYISFPILLLLRLAHLKLPIKGKLSAYDTTSTKEDFIWSIGFIFYLLIKLNRGHNNNSALEHNFMEQLSPFSEHLYWNFSQSLHKFFLAWNLLSA